MTREDALISIGRIQNTMEMMLNEVNRRQAEATYAAHLAAQAQLAPPAPAPPPAAPTITLADRMKDLPMVGFSNRIKDSYVYSPGSNIRNI